MCGERGVKSINCFPVLTASLLVENVIIVILKNNIINISYSHPILNP